MVARIADELNARRAATASVCWYEAWSGARKAQSRRAEVWLQSLANSAIAVLSYDRQAAELHAKLAGKQGDTPLSRAQRDAAIAATALAHGAVLVTDNTAHFIRYQRVGLQLENWLR